MSSKSKDKILEEELDFINKYMLTGPEWSPIRRYGKGFYDQKTQKSVVLHEIGHAFYAYKKNNFRTLYIGKIKGKINFGVVFPKKSFKKIEEATSFYFLGLLGSFAGDEKIKNVLIAAADIYYYGHSSELGFKNFNKAWANSLSFVKKHEQTMFRMSELIYNDCLKNKEKLIRIDRTALKGYYELSK